MILHDYECQACGGFYEDVWFHKSADVLKAIRCDDCGEDAPMVFRVTNGIHYDHSGMYGKYHAGFGCVVESYSHKQKLLKQYNVVESSDPVGGSRSHITRDVTHPAPRSSDPVYWGHTPDEALAAAEQATMEQ
jgi:DNA-directed RNA polymerase subunit RPC12/RpoP